MVTLNLHSSLTLAEEDSAADFFRKDKEYWSQGLKAPEKIEGRGFSLFGATVSNEQNAVKKIIADRVRENMGSEYVNPALKIAKLESNFNCFAIGPKTHLGHAAGVFQVMPKSASAMGYDYSRIKRDCSYGIDAGIKHMQICVQSNNGHMTPNQLSACHVAGPLGWNKHLRKKAERYKKKYIRLASRMRT
jgi:hypothetical protein